MKTLVLGTTAPSRGLAELVAYDEGLFEKEGLIIAWADHDAGAKADLYNACEWRNLCRVQDPRLGSRQVGRRATVSFGAIVVRPDSPIDTPQQLANRAVGVPFYFGTHYLALHMLEGFLPRDLIKVCRVSGIRRRFDAMMMGEVEAATLTEPYVTLAEKKGCRIVCSAFHHGTEMVSDRIDAETYGAFNRAVREAVRRINANKRGYLRYFIDYHRPKDAEIGMLTVEDLRESRILVRDPSPIPPDEMQRTYDWLQSWGMLEEVASRSDLIEAGEQERAHPRSPSSTWASSARIGVSVKAGPAPTPGAGPAHSSTSLPFWSINATSPSIRLQMWSTRTASSG